MLQRKEKIAVTIFGLALFCIGFVAGGFTHYYVTLPMSNFQTAMAALVIPGAYTVPLLKENDLWVVNVKLEGKRDPRFLLDTGASTTMLHPAVAKALGIKVGSMIQVIEIADGTIVTMPLARATQLQVGKVTFNNIRVVLGNPPMQLDGILGNDLLVFFNVTIDPVNQVLILIFSKPQGGA